MPNKKVAKSPDLTTSKYIRYEKNLFFYDAAHRRDGRKYCFT